MAINGTVSKHGKARRTAVPTRSPRVRAMRSPAARKRIEEGFGWTKTVGGLAQVKVRGLAEVRAAFVSPWPPTTSSSLPKLIAPRGELRPAA